MNPIANNMIPFSPTHPGEVLKDEIEFLNISQRKLALQMGVSYSVLNEIINSKRPVNMEFTLCVEAALGMEAEMLMNLQSRYNLHISLTQPKCMEKVKVNVAKTPNGYCATLDIIDGFIVAVTGTVVDLKREVIESIEFYVECAVKDGDEYPTVFDVPYELEYIFIENNI